MIIYVTMRDAFIIRGTEINYYNQSWVIEDFYYVPNNPNLYVKLSDGKKNMNVLLNEITNLIVKNKVFIGNEIE